MRSTVDRLGAPPPRRHVAGREARHLLLPERSALRNGGADRGNDSVDDLVIWDRAPGRSAASLRELGARCTGVLAEVTAGTATGLRTADLHFYRVRRDDACLERTAGDSTNATAGENKNAPRAGRFYRD